jgi:hypothetical protein
LRKPPRIPINYGKKDIQKVKISRSKGSLFCEKADEFLSVGDEENHGYLIFSD